MHDRQNRYGLSSYPKPFGPATGTSVAALFPENPVSWPPLNNSVSPLHAAQTSSVSSCLQVMLVNKSAIFCRLNLNKCLLLVLIHLLVVACHWRTVSKPLSWQGRWRQQRPYRDESLVRRHPRASSHSHPPRRDIRRSSCTRQVSLFLVVHFAALPKPPLAPFDLDPVHGTGHNNFCGSGAVHRRCSALLCNTFAAPPHVLTIERGAGVVVC